MDPLSLTGLITGGANLIGQGINAFTATKTARENTDRTIQANRSMAEYAYSKDLDMWNRANAYNSPQAQMDRLRGAGLNPMLVYGSGSAAGNTTQAATPKYQAPTAEYRYAAPQFDLPSVLSQYQSFQMQKAQIDNQNAQNLVIRQDSVNKAIQNALLAADMKMKSQFQSGELKRLGQEIMSKSIENIRSSQLQQFEKSQQAYELQARQYSGQKAKTDLDQALQNLVTTGLQQKGIKAETANKMLHNAWQRMVNKLQEAGINVNDPLWARQLMQYKDQIPGLKDKAMQYYQKGAQQRSDFYEWFKKQRIIRSFYK